MVDGFRRALPSEAVAMYAQSTPQVRERPTQGFSSMGQQRQPGTFHSLGERNTPAPASNRGFRTLTSAATGENTGVALRKAASDGDPSAILPAQKQMPAQNRTEGGAAAAAQPQDQVRDEDVPHTTTPDASGAGGGSRNGDRPAVNPDPDDQGRGDGHAGAPISHLDSHEEEVVKNAADTVRKRGDVFDQLRRFKHLRWAGAVAAVDAVASGIYPVAIDHFPNAATGEIGLTVVSVAAGVAAKPIARTIERRRANRILTEQQTVSDVVGTPTELIRRSEGVRRTKAVDIRWYGTETEEPRPAELRSYLTKIAAVAKSAELDQIILPFGQVAPHVPQKKDFGIKLAQTELMQRGKHRALRDKVHGKDELLVVTPTELSQLIDNIEVPQEQSFDTIMSTLQRVHPNHPAHTWYAQLNKAPDIIRPKLATIFQLAVDRNHEDATRKVIEKGVHNGKVYTVYEPVHITGTSTITQDGQPSIQWRRSDGWHDQYTTSLLGNVRMSFADMRHMILNPDAYSPNRVTDACEVAAWLTLQGIDIHLTDSRDSAISGKQGTARTGEDTEVSLAGTLQQRTANRELGTKKGILHKKDRNGISLRRTSVGRRALRSAPALLIAGGIGVAVGLNINSISNTLANRENTVATVQAAQAGYKNALDDPHINYDKIDAEVLNTPVYRFYVSPVDTVLGGMFNLTNSLENSSLASVGLEYTPQDIQRMGQAIVGTQPRECGDCNAATGNVDVNAVNNPVWYLKSFNGMRTDGFWAQTVYHSLGDGMDWQDSALYLNPAREKAITEAPSIQSSSSLNMAQPLVQVKQEIDFGQQTFNANYDQPFYSDTQGVVLPLPVLEGAHIVAADVTNAESVRLVTFPDGTQALLLPKGFSDISTVDYWLAPGDGQQLHATVPLQAFETVQPAGIDKLWEKRLGHPLPTNPEERLQVEADFIENHFWYSLTPLKNDDVIFERNTFAQAVLSGDEANCNVAAGILAISNPDLLNIVTGYLNQSGNTADSHYLLGNDAHEVDLVAGGGILDATPSKTTPAEAKKDTQFFGYNPGSQATQGVEDPAQQRQDHTLQELELLGEMTIAAGVFWQRHRLMRGVNKIGVKEAQRSLDHRPTDTLQAIYDNLTYGLYSGRTKGPLPETTSEPPTREELLALFEQYIKPDSYLDWLQAIKKEERK